MAKTSEDGSDIIDGGALWKAAVRAAGKDPAAPDARMRVLALLKQTLRDGRKRAETLLLEDGRGLRCAARLSHLEDEIVRVIFRLASEHVFPVTNPSTAERLAVLAVGGYGRGTLAPGSDIDLLFLRPYKQTPWGESVVEYTLYMLWDLGQKVGHATRSIDECIRLSRSDLTIRTAILEARPICGEEALAEELLRRFDAEIAAGTGPEFIAAKLAERDERHRKQGASRYLVEPNVKEGKGGLRDLHTLFWIAKYYYRVRSGEEMVRAGVFSRAEYSRFRKCEDFLWAVRCHLHFLTGRPEERLSFDAQPDLAARLGYTEHAGLKDVERFMKHYFLVAKDVGDLTRIVCAALEERHAKPKAVLNRFLDRMKPRRRRPLSEADDFVVDRERINIADEKAFERDPVNLIRIFHLADKHNLALHPDAMTLITRSLRLIGAELREEPEANRLFLEVLTSRNQPEIVLRLMNEAGVLGRFVPDFGRVVAMMQFNMYHHYTVDEHLLRSIGILAEIEKGRARELNPLATELLTSIENRRVLYVALFLHDIAKGRPEDHSIAGARIARRLCPRLGLTASETETVAWLVQHHLVMSVIAQSRDLSDRKTIRDFVEVVQSLERLKLLLILTVADIRAVGPGVFTGWKGQLLRTLYYEAEALITGGQTEVTRTARVEEARRELSEALVDWPVGARKDYLELHYPAYWLRVDLPHKIEHANFIREVDGAARPLATMVRTRAFEAVTEITVLAPDHPRLLSAIAGACAAAGANIVGAQIYTTTDGRALDTILLSRAFAEEADEQRRAGRVAELVEQALSGTVRLPEVIARRSQKRPREKAFRIEPQVVVTNAWSNLFTVVEVSGLDRPGLLYDLTNALSSLNLNIASAHIATFGERAVDVFYVTDLTGQKITNPSRAAAIRRRLAQVFDEAPAEAKPVPRRLRRAS